MAEYKPITREELKTWMDEGKDFTLINVLSEGSFEAMRLPGSQHADVHQPDFLEKAGELIPSKDAAVVVYCSSFQCQASPAAAKKLAEAGYTNVYDFEGGLADWKDGGYPFEGLGAEKAE